ncbi:hypothetical protein G6F22_019701 [Rhizopus arrhizus]|nr:hypothetical protein G6F22_019701 [Rhizopus arrhizus]
MANDVTLRQLRYFAAAARTGRFSMAAADEHVSQSAVTNAVLALEAQLGVRLFDRHPHGVTLTPEGHNFHRRTQDILDSAPIITLEDVTPDIVTMRSRMRLLNANGDEMLG